MVYSISNRQLAALFVYCVAFAFVILCQSPELYPPHAYPLTDSSVFQYVGEQILQGKLPYLDVFDHKGPLIYLINALGLFINASFGIWIIEFVFVVGTLVLWCLILKNLEVRLVYIYVISFILGISIISTLQGGNLTEEYILLFSSLVVYSTVRVCSESKNILLLGFITGISIISIVFLKFTALAFGLPLIVFAFIVLRTNLKRLLMYLIGIVIGVSVVFFPVIVWLFSNGAIGAFIDDYIFYNSIYGGGVTFTERLSSLAIMGKNFILLAALACSCFAISRAKAIGDTNAFGLQIANLIGLVFVFLITAGAGRTYDHYALLFIPGYILPFGAFLKEIARERYKSTLAGVFAVVLVAWAFILPSISVGAEFINNSKNVAKDKNAVIKAIKSTGVKEGDKISVIGNDCWVYLATKTTSPSVYAYIPGYAENVNEYFDVIVQDSIVNDAKCVVIKSINVTGVKKTEGFLENFELAEETQNFQIFTRRK